MQTWGHVHVSSAREVYLVLSSPPLDPRTEALWRNLLSIEPPVWGCAAARRGAHALARRGVRVWSWDDHGVVYAAFEAVPPRTLRYVPWHRLDVGMGRLREHPPPPE